MLQCSRTNKAEVCFCVQKLTEIVWKKCFNVSILAYRIGNYSSVAVGSFTSSSSLLASPAPCNCLHQSSARRWVARVTPTRIFVWDHSDGVLIQSKTG